MLTDEQKMEMKRLSESSYKSRREGDWYSANRYDIKLAKFIRESGATKTDMFEFSNGVKACCSEYDPQKIKESESFRVGDDLVPTHFEAVYWCKNCGSIIRGDKITKPNINKD